MLFYIYLFSSVIVIDCIFSINLFLQKKLKIKKKGNIKKKIKQRLLREKKASQKT